MKPASIRALFAALQAQNPEPKTELESTNPYTLLVAIVLSAQATDKGVNKATRALFAAAGTPQKMLALGEEGVRAHIKTINFFNTKAKNVIALSRMLLEEFGGEIPADMAALQRLPGVGRKTANVWMNSVHGAHTIGVDTHVHRVANRTGLCRTQTPEQTEACLLKNVPKEFKLHAHHWLILHGRYTCTARKPACERCIIYKWCEWEGKPLL